MSAQHHGSDGSAAERFLQELTGTAKREYPDGRMGPHDDGTTAYAMANDDVHRTIVIRFTKPMEWIAFDVESAIALRDQLSERILYLQGVRA